MPVRISTRSVNEGIAQAITARSQRVLELQRGLSDGKAIHRPSDDPIRTQQAMVYRERLRANEQYGRNLQSSLSRLSAADASLSQIGDTLTDILALQTSGANDAVGTEGRRALAAEVNQLLEQLVDLGNSRLGNVYIFGGTRTLEAPLSVQRDVTGKIVQAAINRKGADGPQVRSAGPDVSLTVNVGTTDVFGERAALFQTLVELRDALQSGDGDRVRATTTSLEAAQERVSNANAVIGSLIGRTDSLQARVDRERLTFEEGRSQAEDLDVARAVVDFQQEQAALQAALTSGSRVLSLSLLDYMK